MRITTFYIFLMLLCGCTSFAQSTVRGTFHNDNEKPIRKMKLALLQVADSTLVQVETTNRKGQFEFNNVPIGDYILKYKFKKDAANYIDFDFEGAIADFGIIFIEQKKSE